MDNNFNDPDVKDFIKNHENRKEDEEVLFPVEYVETEDSILARIQPGDSLHDSIASITDMYTEFGKIYGIDMKFNINSVSENFKSIIDPKASKVFELYLAEGFARFKLSIIQKIMIAIQTLVDRITSRDILETDNVELAVGLLDKLFSYMDQVNKINDEIRVDSGDMQLKNIAKDLSGSDTQSETTIDDIKMMAVLRELQKTTIKGPQQDL